MSVVDLMAHRLAIKDAADALEQRRVQMRALFDHVRKASVSLAAPLTAEDQQVQSMPDASPTKWHLAHTTWFFEAFLLGRFVPGYAPLDERYHYLFNSYYEAMGARHPRPQRGLVTRPTLAEVHRYRVHVDAYMRALIDDAMEDALDLIELGCHHEQQHQELLLTDIKHALSQSALDPAYLARATRVVASGEELRWHRFDGGLYEVGHGGGGFAFDNEGPRHTVHVSAFNLASRAVTNGEYLAFMRDGGYTNSALWLSDGWRAVQEQNWQAPLYWRQQDDTWFVFTLSGLEMVDLAAPVTHVSHFEADAFAHWAGKRLPREEEWEIVASQLPQAGNFVESGAYHPQAAQGSTKVPLQMFGDVWEWTQSAYLPYPGFRAAAGAVGEYNGKFMSGQMVLRGGSCATPAGHIRATYRNFFPPTARWQFSGIRLASDA
jgi:ergothioneine biosynthesis protein EgtB